MSNRIAKRLILLSEAQNHRCAYCCSELIFRYTITETGQYHIIWSHCGRRPTIDHVHPLSKGGTNAMDNLVVACANCNHKKQSRDAYEFFYYYTQKIIKCAAKSVRSRLKVSYGEHICLE